jgi:hypothetical protein
MSNLVIIDDEEDHRIALVAAVRLVDPAIEIREWSPDKTADVDPYARFKELIDDQTVFVVTDYDLTKQGPSGLFGDSIVSWCQMRSIPVGDYSRRTVSMLPEEPNQYEIRVPVSDDVASATFIVGVFRGFSAIGEAIAKQKEHLEARRSPVALLSLILGRPQEEARFSLYGVRLGASNPSLQEHLRQTNDPPTSDKQRLLTYVIGHLLLNVVLKYPGPILTMAALAAYAACDVSESETLLAVFEEAKYLGPFNEVVPAFWLSDVDEVLRRLVGQLPSPPDTLTVGELNRLAVEHELNRALAPFACTRCEGKNGGFWCPFTKRPVCLLPTCSVSSNAWIPQGARSCRIERGFYDEWAPVLGF